MRGGFTGGAWHPALAIVRVVHVIVDAVLIGLGRLPHAVQELPVAELLDLTGAGAAAVSCKALDVILGDPLEGMAHGPEPEYLARQGRGADGLRIQPGVERGRIHDD